MNFAAATKAEYATYGEQQKRYIEAAQRIYNDEGRIEVDDETAVSDGCDSGAYVMAWVWVSNEDLAPADAGEP